MGHAISSLLAPGEFCSTMQFSVQYLMACRPGDRMEAEGWVTRKGRRVAYLEGTCTNAGGDVVARAHGTWYVGQVRP
jgi:acyl-coenzyme A thioesterase PaaI-like protein